MLVFTRSFIRAWCAQRWLRIRVGARTSLRLLLLPRTFCGDKAVPALRAGVLGVWCALGRVVPASHALCLCPRPVAGVLSSQFPFGPTRDGPCGQLRERRLRT